MVNEAAIPAAVKEDISIYLGPDEKVVKAISSVSGKIASIGEIWLLLTSHSIFFHTKEHKKEPVIALMPLKDIKEIDYFQKTAEIILTFVPAKKQGNSTRLSFPASKRAELEDFCDDLADLINFRMETTNGVKVFPRPSEPAKPATSDALTKEPLSRKPTDKASAKNEMPSLTKESVKTVPSKSAEVKIVGTSSQNKSFSLKYALLATLISVIVGYVWYQFFRALNRRAK